MGETEQEARIHMRLTAPHRVPFASLFSGQRGTLAQRLRAFASACFMIERAHAAGIVHRDLHPQTILVGETWDADVIGWSSAYIPDELDNMIAPRTRYTAPEVTRNTSDPRADIYSLGQILSELVAGVEGVPELEQWCRIATSPDPVRRIVTAGQLGEYVLGFLEGVRDWELRRTIAATHLANARAARADGRGEVAWAEAANALRLDPGSRPAADFLVGMGRVPREIKQLIDVEVNYGLRDSARIALWAYVGYIVFAPAFLWLAAGAPGYAIALLALVALNIGLLAVHGYTSVRLHEIWFVLANAALIALVARVASPFVLAPGIAAVTATALGVSPSYLRPPIVVTMIACLSAAVLLPWVAELAGALSPTMTVVEGGLRLQAPAFHLRHGGQLVLLVFYVITLLSAAGWLAFALTRRERRLRYRTYLQLWQMRENLTNVAAA